MDFIQNAELKNPIQAQREFFVHQYVSLLCMVVQWKTVEDEAETLRTRTILFMSDDKKHDGAFAAFCLKHLISQVLPVLPQLQNNWTRLIVSSDNGPHFAQQYLFHALAQIQFPDTVTSVWYTFDCPYHGL
jgi:hypothetical protein